MTNNNNDANKRIAKNTLFLYLRLALVLIISLYTSRVILHNLGVSDYGLYNVVAGFVSMFALLSTSLTKATQRFYNYEKGRNGIDGEKRVFISSNYIQIIIAVLILVLTETIGLWYVSTKMVYPPDRALAVQIVYQASIFSLLLVVLQIPFSAAIIAHERINYYAIVGVIDVILKLFIALVIAIIPFDNLCIYGVLVAGVTIINFVLYYSYAKRHFPHLRFKRQFHRDTFTSMIQYSGWSAFNGFSQTIKNQGLNVLMNFFFGPTVNAARGISYQVKSALLNFVLNITTAAQPQVVESYAVGNKERATRLMFAVSKFIFISLFMASLPIMVEVSFVLRLWLGNDVPDYTEIFTILVLIITLVDILTTPITMIINASGRVARYNFWNSIIGISVLPVAYVFLNQGADPVSVYVVSLFISIIMVIISIVIMMYETGIKVSQYFKGIILPLTGVVVSSVFLPVIIFYFISPGFFRFFLVTICSVLLVAISGYYIGLNTNERSFVLSYAKRFIEKLKIQKKK